jgi:hypothetical protein
MIVQGEFVSMINFNARFDGKVIVPEKAVNLPQDRSFTVHVEPFGEADATLKDSPESALQWLAENAVEDQLPSISPLNTITIFTAHPSGADSGSCVFRRHRLLDCPVPPLQVSIRGVMWNRNIQRDLCAIRKALASRLGRQ